VILYCKSDPTRASFWKEKIRTFIASHMFDIKMSLDVDTNGNDEENDWSEHVSLLEDEDRYETPPQAPWFPGDRQHKQLASPSSTSTTRKSISLEMPPQLHPACSLGVWRVSSGYFSLASSNNNDSMTDLLSQLGDNGHDVLGGESKTGGNNNESIDCSVDVFYHDILMQVFTFLDPNSLLCFSETARRPNFEVFYYLQLQLQQALVLDQSDGHNKGDSSNDTSSGIVGNQSVSTIEGSASTLSRVARLDMGKASELLEEYQASNSTLRTMPLSYSLAYVRHYLLRNGFHNMFSNLKRHMLEELMSKIATEKRQNRQPILFDPYDHLSSQQEGENDEAVDTEATETVNATAHRKMPSGCVGAYSRAINRAADYLTGQIREKRKSAFGTLSPEHQRHRSLEFLSVCTSNDTLDRVKEMISVIDVNRFYVGNDGTETCALHTACFDGADKVVEFLCAGIDHRDPRLDGGLCDVNAKDVNGWTALHFAAASNSFATVRVLAHRGAILNVVAHNGYSPLTWAVRLSNENVARELRDHMNRVGTDQNGTWKYTKPFASIANHFFSLIPSQ